MPVRGFFSFMGKPRKIFIVHASVGSGHKSAALALAEAFEDDMVSVFDILDFGRIPFNGDAAASMFIGPTRPIYDLTWRFTFTGRLLWGGNALFSLAMFPRFTQLVLQEKPDAIVCTHIVAANCAAGARMLTHQNFPLICVPTDYETEGFWPHKQADLFCIGTEAMAETLRCRRIPDKKIVLSGIPTNKGYRTDRNKESLRKHFSLPEDKQIVLCLAGANLATPYKHFKKALKEILPYMHTFENMHFVVVTGKDADFAEELARNAQALGCENLSILHYVDNMAGLMKASDIVVCKSGGLTTTECLCAETPMILIGQAYGQEKANVLMLTGNGAALHVTTSRELIDALKKFSEHPESHQAFLINASLVRKPYAALDITKATHKLIDERDVHPYNQKLRLLGLYWGHKPAHTR